MSNKEFFNIEELREHMKEKGIERLDELDNFAHLTTSNYGGMVIVINSTGECVFVQEVWGKGKYKEIEECRINYGYNEYTEIEDEPYFDYKGEKYFLNEFIRSGVV